MRWAAVLLVLGLLVLAGLGACAPDAGSWTTGTDRIVPENRDGASAEGSTRPVAARRARAARPPAEAPPFTGHAVPAADREPEDPPPPPDPDEDAAAFVVGRVVDAAGSPLPRAEVECFLGVSTEDDLTDDDGRFRMRVDEPTGAVRVLAWARGWAVSVGGWRTLDEGETLDVGTIRLAPAAWIDCRVVDPSGAEVGDARDVRIESDGAFDEETWALLTRHRDGRRPASWWSGAEFRFDSLPPGRYVLSFDGARRTAEALRVTAPDEHVTFVVSHEVASPPVAFETLVRVVDADGAPIALGDWSLRVCVPDEESPRPYWRLPWSEGDGDGFRVRIDAPRFPVELVVHPAQGDDVVVTLEHAPGEAIEVRLPPATSGTLTLTGTVTADGVPLAWKRTPPSGSRGCYGGFSGTATSVRARRADGTGPVHDCDTASDGTFALRGLDDADYDVWTDVIIPPGLGSLCPAEVRVRAGAVGLVLDMPHGGTRRFEIRGPGGAKLDEIDECVTAMDEDAADAAESESDGTAIVASVLRPGATYRLTVRGRIGRTWTAWTHVEGWTAGEGTIPVELDPGLTIRGQVVRADGSAVPAAYVYAERGDDDSDDHSDTYAALDGTFTLTGLSPCEWRVVAYAPALSNEDARLPVVAGASGVRVVVAPRSPR